VGFEGGQTPFYLRVPKRGFTNIFHKEYVPLNVGTLQWYIDNGRIDPSKPIDMHTLKKAGVAKKIKHGIKLLGNGSHLLTSQLNIEVSRASKKAIEAVEANGGRIVTAYYNRLGLRVLLSPEKFEGKEIPRRALPSKHDMIYYLNPENRGYLLTEAGQKRLAEGGMEGAYLHPDGRVAIPGKKTTLYTGIAPTKAEAYKEVPVEKNIPEEFNWQ
jgi:large subunit ribosomal protein L15